MVKGFGEDTMIYSWMRNRITLEFIGIWEEMNNPGFKGNEFVTFKNWTIVTRSPEYFFKNYINPLISLTINGLSIIP
jgi:hypothetical protein